MRHLSKGNERNRWSALHGQTGMKYVVMTVIIIVVIGLIVLFLKNSFVDNLGLNIHSNAHSLTVYTESLDAAAPNVSVFGDEQNRAGAFESFGGVGTALEAGLNAVQEYKWHLALFGVGFGNGLRHPPYK